MSNIIGMLIRVDGLITADVTVNDHNGSHLQSMYQHVNCHAVDRIELHPGGQVIDMWVDDEGRINGKTVNLIASILMARSYPDAGILDCLVHGNALLLGVDLDEGEAIDLPAFEGYAELLAIALAQDDELNNRR